MTSRTLLLVLAPLLLSGCAIKSTMAVMDAEQAVRAAEAAGAEQLATHDVTMARAYMEEAHRQWARSRYASADQLAAEALRLAGQAQQKAAIGGDPEQIVPEDAVPEDAVPEEAPEVAPEQPGEPDDSELMELIEQDKEEKPDEQPSIMEEKKLDEDIFEEEMQ